MKTSLGLVIAVLSAALHATHASPTGQYFFGSASESSTRSEWTEFKHPVKKVAVIGAGPAGLQAAATLIEEGFEVRLVDRQDGPGGNWYHQSDKTPVRESYPNDPLHVAAYTPDVRDEGTHYYEEGEDGLSLDERWREHARPSPVWDHLGTNSVPHITTLPGVSYPKDIPWVIPAQSVHRHVRSYASAHGLNANDLPWTSNTTSLGSHHSYGTRVELLEKNKEENGWDLSLRKFVREEGRIKAEWWSERFDAVVVASGGYDVASVPNVKGLVAWSKVKNGDHHPVAHSQSYRNAKPFVGKTVLLVGASVSASEISRDIGDDVERLLVVVRDTPATDHHKRRSLRRLHPRVERIPEVVEFGELQSTTSIKDGKLLLLNGTWISGIDEVILATGFQRSTPFLRDFYSLGGAARRDSKFSPIVTDGHVLHSLSWTGHYIPDPTLAFTNVRPWTLGRFQSLAFAKVWKGTARLPSREQLWDDYFNDNHWQGAGFIGHGSVTEETLARQYIGWLNNESLIHGGRLVDQWPIEYRELFVYYSDSNWEQGYTTRDNFTRFENLPRADWPLVVRPELQAMADQYELETQSEW